MLHQELGCISVGVHHIHRRLSDKFWKSTCTESDFLLASFLSFFSFFKAIFTPSFLLGIPSNNLVLANLVWVITLPEMRRLQILYLLVDGTQWCKNGGLDHMSMK